MFKDLRPNIVLGLAGFASVASEWWGEAIYHIFRSTSVLTSANVCASL